MQRQNHRHHRQQYSRTAVCLMAAAVGVWPVLAAAGQPAARGAEAGARDGDNAEMPIRDITLYRSGVGYFERHALVRGDQDVQIRFNVDQINDILKSMVVLDLDGGRVGSVGYGSKAPLDRRLASFAVNVADNPDLATLLNRLRGAQVRVVTADGAVTGTVMGVETRPRPAGEGTGRSVINTPFLNLVTEMGIRTVDVTALASFEILDRELAGELNKALAALAEQRAERMTSVDLSFTGQGERQVVVAYVHEMPVWKTSYRLVLPEPATGEQARREPQQLTMQGWAIVENTSDEDWQNVRLSLVAGRPVSFQMDLYEPLFAERPMLPVPMVSGALPRMYQAPMQEWIQRDVDMGERAYEQRMEGMMRAPASPGPSGAPGDVIAGRPMRRLTADELVRYAPATAARAGEVGEVFRFQLEAPVSVARQRSAMLPILTSNVEGRRVSIYTRADAADHPMRGVQLVNTSGLQLMPGPISVFDGASYAGDAQIGHVPMGDKRLLSYAVDLEVQAIVRDDSASTVNSLRIVNGMIEETVRRRATTAYTFNSKDQRRARLLLVEQPRQVGWELITPREAAESTASIYRFELDLAPGEVKKFDVVQEKTERQRHAVVEYQMQTLLAYATDGKASAAVVDAVRRAADMQGEINTIRRRITQIDQERTQIHTEQNRIRQNMNSVGRDSELYRQYVRRLTEQETRLDEIGLEREELLKSQEAAEESLRAFIRSLNVD